MILLIDNYDSFVFNVEQYLKELTNEEVKTVRNDEITLEGIRELNPDRIVLSPGPKHPKDSGICLEILKNIDNIPILGICLGHQAFGLVFGGKIERLETPLHGKTSEITVIDKNSILFKDMPEKFNVMRYHSLYVSEENLPEDLTAFVKNILEYSTTFSDDTPMIDLCGTGGDGLKTINISTTVAFIVAAMGVKVAKHGNKSVTSKSGSSDVIDKLGLTMEKSLITQLNKLENSNLAFFHAPFFHKLVGEVREVRQRLGIRTVFNVLGPLLHPNRKLKYQLVGLYHEPVHRLYAETLQLLGREHALVVRGNDGLDEISICDETKIVEVKGDKILEYTVSPETFGFKRAFHADIEGGTPEENAEILVRTLKGEENSPKSDIVILNAMFALYTANVVKHPAEAKPLILEAINSGKVYDFYKKYTGK